MLRASRSPPGTTGLARWHGLAAQPNRYHRAARHLYAAS
ncbi:hypothetical protein HEB94_001654 [Actinopolymorpha pittospori]|uniref:Uncharacterized protein n=1 Tax=Actinopolymorpha pittospori TaxID=648752 RepID=A0A927MQ34_9ACTN|nr:hypothetical protein [Actinopolymorpha pittospori]